jgi:hypothetical protein
MRRQVPIFPVTVEEIMSTREFAFGVIDGRAGRAHRGAYATWGIAAIAPRSVVLKRDGKLTVEAVRWFTDDIL